MGGINDNGNLGSTWIFVRSGTAWSQQAKILGSGAFGTQQYQGASLSMSSDGNTLAVGSIAANSSSTYAFTWIWTRSGTIWTQQAALLGTLHTGTAAGPSAPALSADGNTLAVGQFSDNSNIGAVWIWTRSGITWTQQTKLTATGTETAFPTFGASVAIEQTGNRLAVGASNDGIGGTSGAVYIFEQNPQFSGTWVQTAKIKDTNFTGSHFGGSITISADGGTLSVLGVRSGGLTDYINTYTFNPVLDSWDLTSRIFTTPPGIVEGGVSACADGSQLAIVSGGDFFLTS